MKRNHALLAAILLVLVSLGISAWFYPRVPAQIPTHWDLAGNVNGYSPKLWGVVQMPFIMATLWLLLLVLPSISPKGFRLDQFMEAFGSVVIGIIAAMLIWNVIALREAAGASFRLNSLIFLPIGIMFIIIGNYMGKFRKNFFIGVRTPWTLASDEVWGRTHRFTGWLFMLGGLALMTNSIVGPNTIAVLVIISIVVIVPIVYSFLLYKRVEGFGPNGSEG